MCRPPDIVPQVPSARRPQHNGHGVPARWDGRVEAGFGQPSNHDSKSGSWEWNELVASGVSSQPSSRETLQTRPGAMSKQVKKPVKTKKSMPSPLVMAAIKGMCPTSSFPQQPQNSWGGQKVAGVNQSSSNWNRSSPFLPKMGAPVSYPNILQQMQQGVPPASSWNPGIDGLNSLESWAKNGALGMNQVAQEPTSGFVAQGFPLGIMPDMELANSESFGMGGQEDCSDDDQELDEKKYKRMMSNRASAKRSRQRRQVRLDELEIQSAKLRVENAAVQRKLNEANEQIQKYQSQNETLQKELAKLRADLEQGKINPSSGCISVQEASNEHSESWNGGSEMKAVGSKNGALGKRKHEEDSYDDFEDKSSLETKTVVDTKPVCVAGSVSNVSADAEGKKICEAASHAREGSPSLMLSGDEAIDTDFFSSLMECFDGKPFDSLLV